MLGNTDYGPDLHLIPRGASEHPSSMHELMAYVSFQNGDVQKAEQICRFLLSQNPRLLDVIHLWGIIAFHRNEVDEAIKRLRRAVNGYEDPPPLYLLNLGLALSGAGQWDEAIDVLQRACRKGTG